MGHPQQPHDEHARAVIFDVDGVLVDSYNAHRDSWFEAMRAHGVSFSEEDFAKTFGRTSREIVRMYFPDGESLSDDEVNAIDADKEAAYRAIVERDFPAMPGARELIESLHAAGVRVGVGSSGPPENVELALRKLDVCHLISAFVTGMDVTRGKPDPQVFLLAAERLNIEPERCIVVEDAPSGVEAAHRAGMKCVALASTGRDRQELSKAERTIDSLIELSVRDFETLLEAGAGRLA